MQWNTWKHSTVRSSPWFRRAWAQAEGSAHLLLPEKVLGEPDLPSPFVKGGERGLLGFFSGHVSHGLIYGKIISWGFTMVIQNPVWTNPPTHLHRHPSWPGSAWDFNILHARRMHGGMLPLLWQAFPCQKSLSSLLWEVGSSPHGRCAPVCYLNPDGTRGKKCGCGGRRW